MNKTKKKVRKGLLAMVLVVSLACGCICLQTPKRASAKAVAKVTKTITINNKKKGAVWHTLSIKKGEKVKVKMKFLSVKGKPVDKYFQGDNIWLFGFGNNIDPSGAYEDCFFHAKNKGSSKLKRIHSRKETP